MSAKLCLDTTTNFCYASLADEKTNFATYHWRNFVDNGTAIALDASLASNTTADLALPGDTPWLRTWFRRVRVDPVLLRVRHLRLRAIAYSDFLPGFHH
jgi:hypothetical protein